MNIKLLKRTGNIKRKRKKINAATRVDIVIATWGHIR